MTIRELNREGTELKTEDTKFVYPIYSSDIESFRMAYHERRCNESDLYRRAYWRKLRLLSECHANGIHDFGSAMAHAVASYMHTNPEYAERLDRELKEEAPMLKEIDEMDSYFDSMAARLCVDTMTLHRFMSELEWKRLMNGDTLENHTVHRDAGNNSDAVGFCFFMEAPGDAVRWLKGVCNTDVLVTFEVPVGYMKCHKAYYCNPDLKEPDAIKPENRVARTDWCCTSYSRDILKPVRSTSAYRLKGFERLFVSRWCRSYHYTE